MRMMRDAYELAELTDLWSLSAADIRSLVGQGILKLCVRVVAQPALVSEQELTAEGEPFWVPVEEKSFSGLGDLTLRDAFRLVRDGEGRVTHLFLPGTRMLALRGGEGILFLHADLLVRPDHAEQVRCNVLGVPRTEQEAFDFRLFVYDGTEFSFTVPQARALEFMLAQTRAGAPDQHYTEILKSVGSASQRLSSLFSRKPYWTRLLKKTAGHRGWYYLDPDFVIWHGTSF